MHSIRSYQDPLSLLKKDRVSFKAILLSLIATMSLLFPAALYAQYRTSIQGVVTDSSGAVIPGATLTLTNSTLSGNSASFGGGIMTWSGATMTVTDSTLSGNSATGANQGNR